jgi:hypothetical protein
VSQVGEKDGGDSEKKMTKDFLDRWKKIASKYEGPEGEKPPQEKPAGAPGGTQKTPEEELDAFLSGLGQKPAARAPAPEHEEKELDDLLSDFGLEEEPKAEAKPAAPAKPAPPKTEPKPPAAAPGTAPSAQDEAQRSIMDTLKKVGLVGQAPPSGVPPREPAKAPLEEEEHEDDLLLELESLLTEDEEAVEIQAPGEEKAPARREAFEEEDLISELELMLDQPGGAKPEAPAKAQPPKVEAKPKVPVKPEAPAAPTPPKREIEEEITVTALKAVAASRPPEPPRARPSAPRAGTGADRQGRVNGGRVNGGRVNGGRVNGGRVNGGRVNGGRVNGGRVNGGRVNGGRVNGGRVNGGRVNGGRINGGSRRGPFVSATVAQARRARVMQTLVAAMVFGAVFASLVFLVPSSTTPRGPQVDGDISDWPAGSALFYTSASDSSLPPALDLQEYAVRLDRNDFWFTARAGGDFFTRASGGVPLRGDVVLVLIDLDGSSATGYAYHDMGIERTVEVTGWGDQLRSATTKVFGGRPQADWAGFAPAGSLQVAVEGPRIEGLLAGLTGAGQNTRAAFEVRGMDSAAREYTDASVGAATVGAPGVQATVTAVATGTLTAGSTTPSPMLAVRVENPSSQDVSLTALRVVATYGPNTPTALVSGLVWNDVNGNREADDSPGRLSTISTALAPTPTTLQFTSNLTIRAHSFASLLVAVDGVPIGIPSGTSVVLSIRAGSDIVATGASVNLVRGGVAAGRQPGAYIGAPPLAVRADGITLDWNSVAGGTDPVSDVSYAHVDITGLKGNATSAGLSFLVSFADTPLNGATIPIGLPSTIILPSAGGGGGGQPIEPPNNTGADYLIVIADTDDNPQTGQLLGAHGYDYMLRVDGKDGAPITGGAKVMRWDTAPAPGWTTLPQVPQVGFGAAAVELFAGTPAVVVTARNITVLAYATSWKGVRDDIAAPLTLPNGDAGRGGTIIMAPAPGSIGEPTVWPPMNQIPEFSDAVIPVAGVLTLVWMRRRRGSTPQPEAAAGP